MVLLVSFCALAQGTGQTTSFSPAAPDSLWSLYQQKRNEGMSIFKGRQVMAGYPDIFGSGFFPYNQWEVGNVQYEGFWYYNQKLLYDVYRDEVLIAHPGGIPLALTNSRVQAFSIKGHNFVNKAEAVGEMPAGIYQVMGDGKLKIYVRRSRIINDQIKDNVVERNFEDMFRYYAEMNGKVKRFTKQNQLLDFIGSHRQAIMQQVRSSGLKFRKHKDAVIAIIANTFNQLN